MDDFHVKYDQTMVNPLGLTVLIMCGLALLSLPRKYAMVGFLVVCCYIAVGQRIVLFTLDFNFVKLIILFGCLRIAVRGEYSSFRWKTLDSVVLAWTFARFFAAVARDGTPVIAVSLGYVLESLGTYFIVRMMVRNIDDVKSLIDIVAIILLPLVCFFVFEASTSRNVFAMFGGVPEITAIREGKLRCSGPFDHPICAGCYWAVFFPLLIVRSYMPGAGRVLSIIGAAACVIVIFTTNSSTPILGLISGIAGLAAFSLRESMPIVRWTTAGVLFVLHMAMNAPVWSLFIRVSSVMGGSGPHRALVIDRCVDNFLEWAVIGISDVTHWGIWKNDLCVQYVFEAVSGGAVGFSCFIATLSFAFASVGRMWRSVRPNRQMMFFTWGIGVSFFVHTVNFFGLTYFGQIGPLFFLSLALTVISTSSVRPTQFVTQSPFLFDDPGDHEVYDMQG